MQFQAKRRFEASGKEFVEETMKLVKQLRPAAKWGYYGFPYCFNMNGQANRNEDCPPQVQQENDQ